MKNIKHLFIMIITMFLGTNIVNAQVSFKIGDYVKMTPTNESYLISTDLTGYDSAQTIVPNELDLWRVIKVNDDGTVEVVSEYVSGVEVTFKGKIGYQNFVGTLNTIAKQYENNTFTVGSRHIGYNGQTEYITDTSGLESTAYISYEAQGGGDYLYQKDIDLVTEAVGTLEASDVGRYYTAAYWLSSREYNYKSSDSINFRLRMISGNDVGFGTVYYAGSDNKFYGSSVSSYIRPILILKSGVNATGTGTSTDPYVLINDPNELEEPQQSTDSNNDITNNNDSNIQNKENESQENNSQENSNVDNPQTGFTLPIIFIIAGVIVAILIYFFVKKKTKLMKL